MVFTGIPVYLDPPNCQQDQQGGGSTATGRRAQSSNLSVVGRSTAVSDNRHHPQVHIHNPPVLETIPATADVSSGGSSRSILMAERARMAKAPPPDTSLKCPRCESTNTKFCYYNNYSLSQPRHFCKTYRRYWTKGGALRHVPVGGGRRRNRRNKSSSSTNNNTDTSQSQVTMISSGSATAISSAEIVGIDNNLPPPSLPFLVPNIHGFNDYNCGGTDIGSAFPGGRDLVAAGTGNSRCLDFMLAHEPARSVDLGQWRMQQHFPAHHFPGQEGLPHLEPQLLLPLDDEELVEQQVLAAQLRNKTPTHLNSHPNYVPPVKMEDDNQHQNNIGHWNSNVWGDLSNFPATTSSFV